MSIGDQLQKQRKLHDMSQETLANKLGISRQAISRWENGATLPSFSNLMAISDLFNISLDELIRGDEAMMRKLDNEKYRPQYGKLQLAILVSITIAVVVWSITKYFKVYDSGNYKLYRDLIRVTAVLGLGFNLNWSSISKEIERNINKKTIIWIVILLIIWALPIANNILTDW
ncbi:helix-turn-helix domain-containing protein [Companilactobacillus kimchiensis]|uniref:HTH cro/C1-type domain-containing protein n=1 Tax=Companilactobacillus kimchiensis TaxID=993692 RepID=A0A0R2LAZ3_9LACO|nr:helix-turn-helix transcriptional regulator [Companilactobacillus kimchiensis]KRN98891.1 hypothetical protein IV57_GL000701 [Companilactobacillus kimchiensis]